jgi:hypothetical protein
MAPNDHYVVTLNNRLQYPILPSTVDAPGFWIDTSRMLGSGGYIERDEVAQISNNGRILWSKWTTSY